MKKLARSQIDKVISTNGGDFKDPQGDLESIIQASQSLELLTEPLPKSDEICRLISKNQKKLFEKLTVPQVYNLAETYRMYKCDTLKSIPTQIESIFKNDVGKMTKPSSLHYAYLLSQRTKDYGVGSVNIEQLGSRVESYLLGTFNQTDFSVEGAQRENGLSVDSLKALELFSAFSSNPDTGRVVQNFASKISKQAIQQGDTYSFYSQHLTHGDLSPAQLNYYTTSILKNAKLLDANVNKEQRTGLRNFFVQRAVLSSTIGAHLLPSLKGLKTAGSDIAAVRTKSNRVISLGDATKSMKFEIVDSFGEAFKGGKNLKVSITEVSEQSLKDVTTQFKFTDDNSIATWSITNLPAGRYHILFNIDGAPVSAGSVTIADSLVISSVQYAITNSNKFPTKFDGKVEGGQQIKNIKQATDDQYIHVAVEAKFESPNKYPSQVYISLKREGGV